MFPSWHVGADLASWQEAPAAPGPWKEAREGTCVRPVSRWLFQTRASWVFGKNIQCPRPCHNGCVTSGESPHPPASVFSAGRGVSIHLTGVTKEPGRKWT